MSKITTVDQASAPSNPAAGRHTIYAKSDGFYELDPAGTETKLAGGGGWSVVTETTATRSAVDGEFILVTVASCVVTLPAPVADSRVAVKVITATVTDIQIRTSGVGIDIDGTDYSSTGLALSTQYEQISVVSDGTDWFIY